MISLRGTNGALCHITNSRHCAFGYDQRIEAFGERGMLTAENVRPTSVRFSGADETEAADPYLNFFLDRYTTAYRTELDHFLTAIETGTEPQPGFADGRAALALAEAASESARTGCAVPVGKAPGERRTVPGHLRRVANDNSSAIEPFRMPASPCRVATC